MTTPKEITAGDSIEWTLSLPDYLPADSWVLSYALVKTGNQISITGTDNGDGRHKISVSGTTTADWVPGDYRWQAYVTKGSNRHQVGSGRITVHPNFAAQATGFDARSLWRIILDNLMAAYQTLTATNATVAEVDINGRRVRFTDKAELLKEISRAKSEVAREKRAERIKQGLGAGNNVFVRF